MKLILIRHGETVWNKENRCQGFSDIELSETGRKQANLLALSLKDEKVDAIYSSPLKRAYDTACAIAEYHQIEVEVDEGLKEMNQGDLEGLTLAELVANHKNLLERWLRTPASVKMPHGESLAEVQRRAWSAIQRIVRSHLDEGVVVVSHNLAISAVLCKVINLDLNHFRRLRQDLGARNTIEFKKRRRMLISMNETWHLSELKRMHTS